MIEQLKVRKTVAALAAAAITALSVGGIALAQSGSSPPKQPAQTTSTPAEGTAESAAPENSGTDPDNVQDENGKDNATEKSEPAEGPELPGDDGPGGHADEPGNPNADHQHEGQE